MKRLIILAILLVFIQCGEFGHKADLVILNGKVVTIDADNSRAEAIAVIGEKIIAVASNSEIGKYIADGKTRVIDAEGRLVIPGFNDAHIHFRGSAFTTLDFRYIEDINVIKKMVADKVKNSKPGELVRGRGWDHENFPDKQWPTKDFLDEVAPDNPVVLTRVDGHSSLVNSYVLRESGITKDTKSPEGGELVKDPKTGEPTGILKESARRLLKISNSVELTPEERHERDLYEMGLALKYAAKVGVTSIQHLNMQQELFQNYFDKGELTLRVTFSGYLTKDKEELVKYAVIAKEYPKSNDWLRFGYLKGFIDGTLGSGTAMMFEPFNDEPDKIGLPQMPYDELEERVLAADARGFQIGIHAIGTKGNNWILNAFEKAREVNGVRDSRHRSEHAQLLDEFDIPRFAQLDAIASMQPTHCITDKRFAEKRIGFERSKEGAYVWQKLLDVDTHIAFGTDFNVEPMDPLEGIYAAVTRKDRKGEEGDGWFPDQKLSVEEAIRLYTHEAAYAEFMEARKGMLKEGYLADIVIYEQDLFTMPEEDIMKNRVDMTITGGKVVYDRAKND